jgi:oligopeptide transport system substrate-binding protein
VPAAHLRSVRRTDHGIGDWRDHPGVALRWNISRDARSYTFTCAATWSGPTNPLTAEDFLFSLRRAADPRTAASAATMLLPIQNAREVLAGELPVEELGVELLDEFTLQIALTGPTPYFLGLLNHPIAFPVNRRNIEEHGAEFARPGKLVSNGAYTLSRWVPRVQIVLEKNPLFREAAHSGRRVHYWRPLTAEAFAPAMTDQRVPNNQFKLRSTTWW